MCKFNNGRINVMRFVRGVWFFPAIVLAILVVLTLFRISGSSVGVYHQQLYGDRNDPSLLAGMPRPIRSDEIVVTTPATVSQVAEGMPVRNLTVGHGQDMSVALDVPTKEWGSLFRPQNWSFFILPLEYAFAIKWWFLGALLLLSCYFFVLTLVPKRYAIAALLSLGLYFSPFIHWWYQSITILALAYALLIAGLVMLFLQTGQHISRRRRILLGVGLAYAATCFVFTLYVPFVVPVGIGLAAFLGGHLLNVHRQKHDNRWTVRQLGWLGLPAAFALVVAALFLHGHADAVHALSNSVYPGHRTEPSGGMAVSQLLGGYYNFQLQDTVKAAKISLNQCEASNFILIFPFLIPLFAYLHSQRKRLKLPVDWRVIGLFGVAAIFLVRLFVPPSEFLFNALQFNRIPHDRLLIGFGFINICLLAIGVQQLIAQKRPLVWPRRLATVLAFVTILVVGLLFKVQNIGYLENIFTFVAVSTVLAVAVWLLYTKVQLGLLLLVLFSLFSVWHINPVYRGLGILTNSPLRNNIRHLDDGHGRWVVGDYAVPFESLPMSTGAHALSGVYAYPQLDVWQGVGSDPATKAVYNRYAHVFFTVGQLTQPAQGQGAYFDPPALDAFRVHADACSDFFRNQHVRYVLLTVTADSPCLKPVKRLDFPEITFYFYELVQR